MRPYPQVTNLYPGVQVACDRADVYLHRPLRRLRRHDTRVSRVRSFRGSVRGGVRSRGAATYAANFSSDHLDARPIQEVSAFPRVDLLIGGPPCQGFSNLNREGTSVESRRRWRDYIRALDCSSPMIFVMENVPQLLKSPEYADFRVEAEARGYLVEHRTYTPQTTVSRSEDEERS